MTLPKETVDRLVALGVESMPPQYLDGGRLGFLVPQGYQLEVVNPLDPPLLPRVRAGVTMHDRASFCAYVNRYKTAATRIFAEPGYIGGVGGKAWIKAVLDYHEPSEPHHCGHVVTFAPRYSDPWLFWHKAAAQPLKQFDFAELIEEGRADIQDPLAAQLLDIVRTFKANKKVDFDSLTYQPNGTVRLEYSEKVEHAGGPSGALPELITLGIPVYMAGVVYSVPVFVRYRLSGGAVTFQLKIDRADLIENHAFAELTAAVATDTGVEVYIGRT